LRAGEAVAKHISFAFERECLRDLGRW
jgi:hypothetical protein